MLKKSFLKLLILLIGTLLISNPTSVNANTQKLVGFDRYETSAKIAIDGWKQSDYAILTFGNNFPDALSAAPIAKKYKAPILLTETNYIPTDTLNVIQQLKVKTIIIIGGTGVISSAVDNQLNSLGITTTRLFGEDRYETSVRVAEQLNNVSEIAIVTGEDFGDALSISPVAAKKNMPIILVQHNMIPDVVKNYIRNHKITKAYVIGVGSSLDESLVTNFTNVEQINGSDKYQRNLATIDKFKSEMDLNAIYLTTGEDFADGLSGAALASINCNPIFLIGENSVIQKNYLDKNSITQYNVIVLGGRVTQMAIIGSSADVDYEEKKILDVANIKKDDITKIIFYDDRGRLNKPLTVEDNQKIREFMSYIDSYVVKKIPNSGTSGWIHEAIFYNKDNKEIMDITFGDPMVINNEYYDAKGNLDTNKIDEFLKSVDSSWIIPEN